MPALFIATRNPHKVEEIRGILGDAFPLLTLADLPNAPAPVEGARTFSGNALGKSLVLAAWLAAQPRPTLREIESGSLWVVADDSGLEVDALDGAPGVYSARFAADETGAAGNCRDEDNNAKLLRLLKAVPREQRTARFRCVIALTPVPTAPNRAGAEALRKATLLFEGACEGWINFAPTGKRGFGYDPLFVPNGFNVSFAELGEVVKNKISHRARALLRLREHFEQLQNEDRPPAGVHAP